MIDHQPEQHLCDPREQCPRAFRTKAGQTVGLSSILIMNQLNMSTSQREMLRPSWISVRFESRETVSCATRRSSQAFVLDNTILFPKPLNSSRFTQFIRRCHEDFRKFSDSRVDKRNHGVHISAIREGVDDESSEARPLALGMLGLISCGTAETTENGVTPAATPSGDSASNPAEPSGLTTVNGCDTATLPKRRQMSPVKGHGK